MGNIWTGASDLELSQAEIKLMEVGGVDMSRVSTHNIDLNSNSSEGYDKNFYMHYIEVRPE